MSYEILKILVLAFGPVVIYATLRATFEMPELIAGLPAAYRRTLEGAGLVFIVGALFEGYVRSLAGPMIIIGLILLASPFIARKLSHVETAYLEA